MEVFGGGKDLNFWKNSGREKYLISRVAGEGKIQTFEVVGREKFQFSKVMGGGKTSNLGYLVGFKGGGKACEGRKFSFSFTHA